MTEPGSTTSKSKAFFQLRDKATSLANELETHKKDTRYPFAQLLRALGKFINAKVEAPGDEASESDEDDIKPAVLDNTTEAKLLNASEEPTKVDVSSDKVKLTERRATLEKKITAQKEKIELATKEGKKTGTMASWLKRWELEWKDIDAQLRAQSS